MLDALRERYPRVSISEPRDRLCSRVVISRGSVRRDLDMLRSNAAVLEELGRFYHSTDVTLLGEHPEDVYHFTAFDAFTRKVPLTGGRPTL